MKFCKDCKHHRSDIGMGDFAKCARSLNVVSGKADCYCSTMRASSARCGMDAKLFEPKNQWHIVKLVRSLL